MTAVGRSTAANQKAAAAPATSTSSVNQQGQLGKDAFLKLLVAQLKYQNPMQPTDPSTFMAQTAQFSMVEKLEELSAATNQLLDAQRMTSATSLLGRHITWKTTDDAGQDTTKSGTVTGIRSGSSGPTLLVGDTEVPTSAVTDVTSATSS